MQEFFRHPGIDSIRDYISVCVDLFYATDVRRVVVINVMSPIYTRVGITEYFVHSEVQNRSF
jgi:hypothetical protein